MKTKKNKSVCPHEGLYVNDNNNIILNNQSYKQSKYPSSGEYINKMQNIHVMQFYSAIK